MDGYCILGKGQQLKQERIFFQKEKPFNQFGWFAPNSTAFE